MIDSNGLSLLFRAKGDTADAKKAFNDLKTSVSKDVSDIESGVAGSSDKSGQSMARLSSFASDMGAAFSGAAGVIAGATVVVGAFGVAALAVGKQMYDLAEGAREAVSEIDKFQKLTNLSIDSVQGLKVAAESVGDSLETVTEIWESFSELIIEAARGDEEATEKLVRNKINAKTAINDLEGTFQKALKTINEAPAGFRQNAAAMDLMGESGLDMIPIIKAMGGDLGKFTKALKEQGLLIDSEGIKKTKEYSKQAKDLELRFAALKNQIGIELMPALIELGKVAKDFLTNNKNQIIEWGKSIVQWTSSAIKNIQMWAAIMKDIKAGDYTLTNYAVVATTITNQEQQQRDRDMTEQTNAELEARRQKNKPAAQKFDWTDTEDNKKKREEALKEEVAQMANLNRERIEAQRLEFEKQMKANRALLESGGQTVEQFQQNTLNSLNDFSAEVGKLMREGNEQALKGKVGTERAALAEEQKNEWTRFIDELNRYAGEANKLTTETNKKASEERIKTTEAEIKRKYELEKTAVERQIALQNDNYQKSLRLGATPGAQAAALEVFSLREKQIKLELKYLQDLQKSKVKGSEEEIDLENQINALKIKYQIQYRESSDETIVNDLDNLNQLEERITAVGIRAVEVIERIKAAKKAMPADDQMLAPAPDGGVADAGGGGIFSGMVDELQEFFNLTERLPSLSSVFTDFAGMLTGAFQGVANAVGSVVESWVLMGDTGPAMLRKILAAALASIAAESAVKAIYQLAEGFAALFWNPPAAAAHFTAAALYGSIAGVAAVAGRAIAGDAFKQQTSGAFGSSNNQNRSGSGGEVYSESRDKQILNMSRNMSASIPQQSLVIESKGGLSFDELFVIRYQSNRRGGIRDIIRRDD